MHTRFINQIMHISRPTWWRITIYSILTCGFLLRTAYLGASSLWYDELYTYKVARLPISDILFKPLCCHPPLSMVLFHFLIMLGTNEFTLRFFSALAGTLTIVLVYRMASIAFEAPAMIGAMAIMAVASRVVFHSRNMTPYAVALCLSAGMAIIFNKALRSQTVGGLLALGFISFAALMTHYGEAIFLLSLDIAAVIFCTLQSVISRSLKQTYKNFKGLAKIVLAQGPGVVIFLAFFLDYARPNLPPTLLHDTTLSRLGFHPVEFVNQTLSIVQYTFLGRGNTYWLTIFLAVIIIIGVSYALFQFRGRYFAIALMVSLVSSYLASNAGLYLYTERYIMLFAAPLFTLFAVAGYQVIMHLITGYRESRLLMNAPLVMLVLVLASHLPDPIIRTNIQAEREDMRQVIMCMSQHYLPDDQIYVYYGAKPAFAFYNDKGWKAYMGNWYRSNIAAMYKEAKTVLTAQRGWLVFSHIANNEDRLLLDAFSSQATIITTCNAINANAVLLKFATPGKSSTSTHSAPY